ncbi:MAG: hypothetical protein NZ870_05285, partial [bacterium]|nr:hypothetical protein [bacterium]
GLIDINEKGEYYDKFRDRIIFPIFSPNGRVFFIKVPEISGILADEWEIYYIDENGKEEFFDYGSSIVFSPDGNFALILKATGVFSVNLKNGEVEKAIELRNESDNLILGKIINGKLSLSRDGRYLSFSNAQDRGEFYVFEIYSWNPFEYRLKAILNEIGFWSTFSPDGKYIAIQTAEKFDEGLPINPKLVIYDTCTFNKVLEYDLSEYASESMWVTDWR